MITIVSKQMVKEDKIEEFKKETQELIKGSKGEEGCISYGLYQDVDCPNILTFIEHWKDEKAIELHRDTDHFKKVVPSLGDMIDGKEVHFYKLA